MVRKVHPAPSRRPHWFHWSFLEQRRWHCGCDHMATWWGAGRKHRQYQQSLARKRDAQITGEVLCVSEEPLQLKLRQTWNDSRSFQELRIWMIRIGIRMIGSSIHFQMAASTVSFAYQDFLLFWKACPFVSKADPRIAGATCSQSLPSLVQKPRTAEPYWFTDLLGAMSLGQVLSLSFSKEVWMHHNCNLKLVLFYVSPLWGQHPFVLMCESSRPRHGLDFFAQHRGLLFSFNAVLLSPATVGNRCLRLWEVVSAAKIK